jgi:cytidine deaminase
MLIGTGLSIPPQNQISRGVQSACGDCAAHEPREASSLTGGSPADSTASAGAPPLLKHLAHPERLLELAPTPPVVAAAVSQAGPELIKKPNPVVTEKLKQELPDAPFHIPRERAEALAQKLGLSMDQLMSELVPVAQQFARPPISEYMVGAVGRGTTGDLYLGVNLEFPKQSLNQTTHGEQFVVQNAHANGEPNGLESIAISAPPCGHCRQFLNETKNGLEMRILVPDMPPIQLKELLKYDFGPHHLGITGALLTPQQNNLKLESDDPVTQKALEAANKSYSVHTKTPAGVAIELKDGRVYAGSVLDNAAYNPSLNPMQAAIMNLVRDKGAYDDIQRVVLVEYKDGKVSHDWATRAVIDSICPNARYERVGAEQG